MTTEAARPSLYDFSLEKLTAFLAGWGEPAYRARQIYRQLYVNLVASPTEMTDLPKALRERLAAETCLGSLTLAQVHQGDDGLTRKVLWKLPDGAPVESVLMIYPDRATVCVSSQSGCPMACVFCATGKLGFLHDLTPGQIVEQVMWAAREIRKSPATGGSASGGKSEIRNLTNVVFMGMGEPFNNYANW